VFFYCFAGHGVAGGAEGKRRKSQFRPGALAAARESTRRQ